MSDYKEQTHRPTTGLVGTPAIAVRKDKPADLATADQYMEMLQLDAAGALRISEEGGLPTYFGTSQFACDSTGTDIAILPGNASKVVKVIGVLVSTTATAAATGDVSLIRRSAVNTAGTSVNASVGQADSGDAAPSSTPKHYTAHPTGLGASAGTVMAERLVQQAAGTPQASRIFFDLRGRFGAKGLRLNGVAEILALNVAAALGGSGNAWDVTWIWTESPLTA